MDNRERALREALAQWKCPACGGTGKYNGFSHDAPDGQPCRKCGGDGLHPIASKALGEARAAIEGGAMPKPYDKTFGDDRECACGHPYYRHFDTYEEMPPVGCKYCECDEWHEAGAERVLEAPPREGAALQPTLSEGELRGLVGDWRERKQGRSAGEQRGMNRCADELERVLAAGQGKV